ncbi:P27 family phage terminase small subunit [Aeromonas salmonicida]|uniref:P27 family phage terminase small subunit n=1 Tax=Aeromonas salmonicida TaxID=645 RepID=UPI000F7B2FF1|nr:P27 family phage terminase small subunit [Aeromonas salmonicida]RSM24955.1 hypothetical protein C5B77_19360 [Aeromonas salmonicida]
MSVMNVGPEALVIYKKYLKVLKKERDIKPSDFDVIALLAMNVVGLEKAIASVNEHGFMISSSNEKGINTVKQNPACTAVDNYQRMVARLLEQLLMTPKAKASAGEKSEKNETEVQDPLSKALLALRPKRGTK